jgi:hypothetical protein
VFKEVERQEILNISMLVRWLARATVMAAAVWLEGAALDRNVAR